MKVAVIGIINSREGVKMEGVNYRAINLVSVCVDGVEDGEIVGRIYNRYSEEHTLLHGVGGLLTMMEELFDAIKFPQASTSHRSFKSKRAEKAAATASASTPAPTPEINSSIDIRSYRGKKGTLLIYVRSRQNTSWQGAVLWEELGVTLEFRSVLELLKLIDSCVEEITGAESGD
jgi:hypothetical protein